jgi:hypothetical protein
VINPEKVEKLTFCYSGLDPESDDFNMFWTPAIAGLIIGGLFA